MKRRRKNRKWQILPERVFFSKANHDIVRKWCHTHFTTTLGFAPPTLRLRGGYWIYSIIITDGSKTLHTLIVKVLYTKNVLNICNLTPTSPRVLSTKLVIIVVYKLGV